MIDTDITGVISVEVSNLESNVIASTTVAVADIRTGSGGTRFLDLRVNTTEIPSAALVTIRADGGIIVLSQELPIQILPTVSECM